MLMEAALEGQYSNCESHVVNIDAVSRVPAYISSRLD